MDLYKNRILSLSLLFLFIALAPAHAQHSTAESAPTDTQTLKSKLQRFGTFHAHARSFFMATDNQKPLTDYVAWGLGAGIGYESPAWKGLQFGISGFFIFNVVSSDLGDRKSVV